MEIPVHSGTIPHRKHGLQLEVDLLFGAWNLFGFCDLLFEIWSFFVWWTRGESNPFLHYAIVAFYRYTTGP